MFDVPVRKTPVRLREGPQVQGSASVECTVRKPLPPDALDALARDIPEGMADTEVAVGALRKTGHSQRIVLYTVVVAQSELESAANRLAGIIARCFKGLRRPGRRLKREMRRAQTRSRRRISQTLMKQGKNPQDMSHETCHRSRTSLRRAQQAQYTSRLLACH